MGYKLGDKYMKIGKKIAGKEIGSIVAFMRPFCFVLLLWERMVHTNVFTSFIKAVGKWFS
jgi:hypothetical protein